MSAVAEEIGINRVTLYRWFGSRDRFLVEVVWGLTREALELARGRVATTGPRRIVGICVDLLEQALANPGMQRWLAEEGEHAMRLLSRHETDGAGRLDLGVDLHELAYVIVRLLESYAYLDLITGEPARAARAEPILAMLLRT
jgi:AcrR family transcriptional regulator